MGTFAGHAVPGTFLIIYPLFHIVNIFHRYFISRWDKSIPFRSSTSYPCCICKRIPLEAILKVFSVCIGITGETITGFKNGKFVHMVNLQHITMFFFFGMHGIVDILMFYKLAIPNGIDYITMILAFAIEGLLFYFHLHGRSSMDVQIHLLLIYTIVACVISSFVEMKNRDSVIASLSRSYFIFIQGTWFYQIGFLLYNPLPNAVPWDEESHTQMMIMPVLYAWHCAAAFIITMSIGCVVYCCHKRTNIKAVGYHTVSMERLIPKDQNGQLHRMKHESSESEIEVHDQQEDV